MWIYEKKLIYPVKVTKPNPRMARIIANLFASDAGEMSASMTYLNQRFVMPDEKSRSILTDVGTEELAHMEMLQSMLMQCLKGASKDELIRSGMYGWVQKYGENAFPADWGGNAWTADYIASTGDPIANLTHDMGAEQRARAGYEGALRLCDDPDLVNALQFLRMREIVHYQRFGETLEALYEKKDRKTCF